jgi:predicted DCC family thiol-disulfide oxidoreductase YuxK
MSKKSQKKVKNQQSQISKDTYLDVFNAGRAAVRAADRKLYESVPKGVQYNWLHNVNYNNVVYPIDKIPDRLLRLIERRNPVVGAITTLRIQQGIEYAHISHDKDIPGWEIALSDEKATITPEQEKQKKFLENILMYGHREDYEPFQVADMPPTFRERMTMYMRDRLLIDKVCWEIERNRKGETVALWTLDGATIYPVLPGGFYGSVSQISTGMIGGFNKLTDAIRKAKIENIPPVEEIAFVQEVLYGMTGGGIAAAFRNSDLIYDISSDLNDIRYYKQGYSVVEKANMAVTAFINSIAYNSNGLARGAIPKVAVAMGKESGYTQEQMEDLQDEWMANFEGVDGQWNIPLLNGDAKILNLMPNNRDMEYQKYMEFCGALICSIMGADPAEAGLRFNQAQNVLSENQDAKQVFSKNRGLNQLLGDFAYIVNRWLRDSGYKFAREFVFRFNGLANTDKGFEADLNKKKVETYLTINELRKELGLKPDKDGDIILNSVYLQAKQAAAMEQGGGEDGFQDGAEGGDKESGFGGFSDDDIDSAVDEAVSGMEKAIRLI